MVSSRRDGTDAESHARKQVLRCANQGRLGSGWVDGRQRINVPAYGSVGSASEAKHKERIKQVQTMIFNRMAGSPPAQGNASGGRPEPLAVLPVRFWRRWRRLKPVRGVPRLRVFPEGEEVHFAAVLPASPLGFPAIKPAVLVKEQLRYREMEERREGVQFLRLEADLAP